MVYSKAQGYTMKTVQGKKERKKKKEERKMKKERREKNPQGAP